MNEHHGWIGVDFDGTLAFYERWTGLLEFGDPIPAMVARVKLWLEEGYEVKVFTARAAHDDKIELAHVEQAMREWTFEHIGVALEMTCVKDGGMIELWDDRAVGVIANTGMPVGGEEASRRHLPIPRPPEDG